MIPLFSNSLGKEELNRLKQVFSSRWLGYGSVSKEFEKLFAKRLNSKYALGINCCTAGLFMSMEILDIKKGDEVIIPSIAFIACANSVIKAGAKPVFADVDRRTLNIIPSEVERLISSKTKAIMLLHYGGVPARMEEIIAILKKQNKKIYLIEDSANSPFSKYKKRFCGTLGDIGVVSFDVNKILVTGSGGMFMVQDDDLFKKALITRFYGLAPQKSSGLDALKSGQKKWWEIELEYPGNRYLINDIISAIGIEQLKKVDQFIQKRKEIWQFYKRELQQVNLIKLPPDPPSYTQSSYYLFWIQVENEKQHQSLVNHLIKNDIYTTFRYYPLHLIKYYGDKSKLPNSEVVSKTTLNIPFHQNLTVRDLDKIVKTINKWAK